jgi:NAD(P)-dependent dehydrogenase (short-subunit alcohol dehydrogenase family)
MRSALVISGAGGALGAAFVAHFAKLEALVVAAGRGVDQANLDEKHGVGRTLAAPLELASAPSWREFLARLSAQNVVVESAVLAAGGWKGGTPLHETSDEVWSSMLNANLESARVSLQALLPGMLERGRGSIVLIASAASVRPWEQARAAAYAAAKAGALALVQATAAECLTSGVRINAVLPSTIDTPANRAAMPKADVNRWVLPQSLARVVEFLLSDAARDVSGAALPVYGRVSV